MIGQQPIKERELQMIDLTMRDFFASAALQGICANPELRGQPLKAIAETAYRQAEEMMEARKQ